MRSRKVFFKNAEGLKLAAYLDFPIDGKPRAYALFAHGFTLTKHLKATTHINRALAAKGIAVLRFDFTGLAESEGDFADTNFSSNVSDIVSAARFLEEEYEAPKILIGHSLGGAATFVAARDIPSARAISTIGAPCDPAHIAHIFAGHEDELERKGELEISIGGRKFRLKKQFLDDVQEAETCAAIHDLKRALLIFHSPVDEIVDIKHAQRIYESARHPKSFVTLDQADHLLSRESDARYVGSVIATWADKYLPVRETEWDSGAHAVRVRTGSSYYTEIKSGGHGLLADEPVRLGGTDRGPTPYGLLISALGACTSITLRMYADRKGWSVDEINVYLNHEKVHAEDCKDCPETSSHKIDHIERLIEVVGDLDEVQRKRLLEIADRCPVHKTLHEKVHITTAYLEGEKA
jgi:putative redox protein